VAEFKDFFKYVGFKAPGKKIARLIRETFYGEICEKAPVYEYTKKYPVELAYALSQISVIRYESLTPPWILRNYPTVENVLHIFRNRRCKSCAYCDVYQNEYDALKKYFGFNDFRSYKGVPLQKTAVNSAIAGKSLLVIFPTAGGKSVAFQLPALMAGVIEK
jgi:ATP-dependent DNA helicase RecQ